MLLESHYDKLFCNSFINKFTIYENAFSHEQLPSEIQKMNDLKGQVEKKYEEWAELSNMLEA